MAESPDQRVKIRYLVLDVLKPHTPSIVELSRYLAENVDGIEAVQTEIVEIDQDTESVKVEVYGRDLDLAVIKKVLREYGATIHSVDVVKVERGNARP